MVMGYLISIMKRFLSTSPFYLESNGRYYNRRNKVIRTFFKAWSPLILVDKLFLENITLSAI